MDDLEEELSSTGVEDEDGSVDGFGRQVALKCLVDGHSVHVGVINKPTKQHDNNKSTNGG